MVRRLVIGDIHGCYTELQDLLDKAGISDEDEIIALGDIVDRGPDTPNVLRFFRDNINAGSLMGNHERKHIRSARGELRPALSQMISRRQLGEREYPRACQLMEGFDKFREFPEAILVHGFYEPGLSLSEQRDTVIIGTLSGEGYLAKRFLGRPWYELYDQPRPVIVGHHDYLENGHPLVYQDRVFAIDTGCCRGGALTGIVLPDFRIVSVPSHRDYWADVRTEHADLRFGSTPVGSRRRRLATAVPPHAAWASCDPTPDGNGRCDSSP